MCTSNLACELPLECANFDEEGFKALTEKEQSIYIFFNLKNQTENDNK